MSPETLLKAARKAYPEEKWYINTDGRLVSMLGRGFDLSDDDNDYPFNKADQIALQIALEKEGWKFGYGNDLFNAELNLPEAPYLFFGRETKPKLLAQCVEASQ